MEPKSNTSFHVAIRIKFTWYITSFSDSTKVESKLMCSHSSVTSCLKKLKWWSWEDLSLGRPHTDLRDYVLSVWSIPQSSNPKEFDIYDTSTLFQLSLASFEIYHCLPLAGVIQMTVYSFFYNLARSMLSLKRKQGYKIHQQQDVLFQTRFF